MLTNMKPFVLALLSLATLAKCTTIPVLSARASLPAPAALSCPTCTPSGDTCDFYECLESEYQCGPSGYPMGYGHQFCSRFDSTASEFSTQGKVWIHDVRLCLQEALVPEDDCSSSCSAVHDDAFASHSGCYISAGLCDLPISDWFAVLNTIGLKTLVETALPQALQTAVGCAELYAKVLEMIL